MQTPIMQGKGSKLALHLASVFGHLLSLPGADPEISERGGRKPNSRKGEPEFDFAVPLSVIFL